MEKIWKVYEEIAAKFPNVYIIDGERKEDKILTETLRIVKKALKG
jgi:thymidylate kinase